MKTKILRIASHTFTCLCFASLIIESLLLLFFSDAAARHPHGALDKLNISLMITFLVSLVIVIFIGDKWDESAPSKGKQPRKRRTSAPWRISLFGHYVKVRPNFFWVLGILFGSYFVLSGKFFVNLQEFNHAFKWCVILFIPAYIFIYKGISAIFFKKPKNFDHMTYMGFTWRNDVEMYFIGVLGGVVVAFIIKGVIALFQTFAGFLSLCVIILLLTVFISSKTIKK